MQTRNVVILVTVVFLVLFGLLIVKPSLAVVTNEANAQQPAEVNKAEVIAILDANTQENRKKGFEAFKRLMREEPPYVIIGTMGYPFAQKGEYEKAVQISQEEIRENPDILSPRYTLAWIYAKLGSYDKAIEVCDDAVKRGPEFNNIRILLAWVYAKQGKYDDALKVCDDALRVDSFNANLYFIKGRIQEFFGHNDEAIQNYNKAISIKKDFAEAYVFLGMLYTELGRYDEAVKAQKQAISSNKYGPGGYLGLGLAYDEMGNYQGALDILNKAIILGSFGTDVDSPIQPLAKSIGIDDTVIFSRIGILNIRLGNYHDAMLAFNNTIKAQSDFAQGYRGLALSYLLLGNKEEALKTYQKLQNIDEDMAKTIAQYFK